VLARNSLVLGITASWRPCPGVLSRMSVEVSKDLTVFDIRDLNWAAEGIVSFPGLVVEVAASGAEPEDESRLSW
jgi:hypothetical protein